MGNFLENMPLVAAALGSTSAKTQSVRVFGYNGDVDTAGAEVIQSAGATFTWPSASATLQVASGSANDAAAGTGARTILVEGLDASWAPQSTTATLNGVTPVVLTGTWTRVNRITVVTAGSGGTNAGILTVQTAGAVVFAVIAAGDTMTQNCLYTVPDGQTAAMVGFWGASSGAGILTFTVRSRNNLVADSAWKVRGRLVVPAGAQQFDPCTAPILFGERTDIEVRATTSADNAVASATVSLFLVAEAQRAFTDT